MATLGRGGMADIYLAVARGAHRFNKLVVVKHLRSYDDDRQAVESFLDEARLAARLNHPNIVDTYDVGRDDDAYFIAMEYLDGQSLSRIMRAAQQAELPGSAWVRIVADALQGLHYAHELCDYDGTPFGLVHRDISPPNIFVTYGGEIKIVDFGIAKATLNTYRTNPGIVKGKLGYMAPEQAAGIMVDRRADIFSMGVVLWETLVRRRLLEGGIRHVLDERGALPLPTVVSVKPDVDVRLSHIVERALALDPHDRYPTAAEMSDALENYLLDVPDAMSRAEIGKQVGKLFAQRRLEVQRKIEKHLAMADQAVIEGDFWASSGIVVAGDVQANPGSPRLTGPLKPRDALRPPPLPQGSPSTQPHALSDSWAPPPQSKTRAHTPWIVLGGSSLVLALGFRALLPRLQGSPVNPAAEPAAALEPSIDSTPVPARLAPSAPAKSEPESSVTPRPPNRRFTVRPKKSHASQADTTAEAQESSPPMALAQPEAPAPPAAPISAPAPVAPPAATRTPSSAPIAAAPAELSAPPGSINPKEVASTVRAHAAEVRACWDRARMDHPDLHGRVVVQARVSPAGRVLSTSVNSTVEDGARLQTCVVSAFESWTFPAPTGGVNGSVSYSFVFE